ncbi:unnamed protein product [Cladocopium goreaui]|nr:unnamed protein product [Cladocopium goreaui]
MGRARQLYGQESSCQWPFIGPMFAAMVVTAFCLICWLTAAKPPDVQQSIAQQIREDSALGPNRDQRGCLQSAGFVWCEGIGRCIRPWKETCPGGTEFCRSYCATLKLDDEKRKGLQGIRCGCQGLLDFDLICKPAASQRQLNLLRLFLESCMFAYLAVKESSTTTNR